MGWLPENRGSNAVATMPEMPTLEFFFDCSSPWTYFAFRTVPPVCAATGTRILWKPFLVGVVFNQVNDSVYRLREHAGSPKMRYLSKDIQDWARHLGLRIAFPPPVFPVNSARAMRGALLALERGILEPYAEAVFAAYWSGLQDISQAHILLEIWQRLGQPGTGFLETIDSEPYRQRLKDNTDELIRRGGFGTPTFFIDGADMYFGGDRLPLIEKRLRTAQG